MGEVFKQATEVATGLAGTAMAYSAASSQADYLNQQMDINAQRQGLVSGLDEFFLGGGKASQVAVPGFQQQFGSIDLAAQEEMKALDRNALMARQMISRLPNGGAKLNALARLAIETEEKKGQISRNAQAKKSDLDVQLTNQYMQQAMGRTVGLGPTVMGLEALSDYRGRQADLQAIGGMLGKVGDAMTSKREVDGVGESRSVAPVGDSSVEVIRSPQDMSTKPNVYWNSKGNTNQASVL